MRKRFIFALLFALVVCLVLIPTCAFAEEGEQIEISEPAEQLKANEAEAPAQEPQVPAAEEVSDKAESPDEQAEPKEQEESEGAENTEEADGQVQEILPVNNVLFNSIPDQTVFNVSNEDEFDIALKEVNGASSGKFVINMIKDIELKSIKFFERNTSTLFGNDHILISSLPGSNAISVADGAVLNLGDNEMLNESKLNFIKDSSGRHIYLSGTLNIFDGVTLDGKKIGGGIDTDHKNPTAVLTMNGGTIENCLASETDSEDGGAMYFDGESLTIKGGKITNNYAARYGGGLFVNGDTKLTMEGGEISNNIVGPSSNPDGGGIFANCNSFSMTGGTIKNNKAYNNGGGVCVYRECVFTMSGGEILDNWASNAGGGVYVGDGSTFIMNDGVFSGNSTTNGGGAVYVSNGGLNHHNDVVSVFEMNGGSITENSTHGLGGGVGGSGCIKLNGGIIKDNSATKHGDDFYCGGPYSSCYLTSAEDFGILKETGFPISGWFYDTQYSRWKNFKKEFTSINEYLTPHSNPLYLKAAHYEYRTLYFDVNGGIWSKQNNKVFDNDNHLENVELGKLAVTPIAPTRNGYIFIGWFDENPYSPTPVSIKLRAFNAANNTPVGTASVPFDFGMKIYQNYDLTAHWEEISLPVIPSTAASHIIVGVTSTVHKDIMTKAAEILARQGIRLDIKVYDDELLPNEDLAEGKLTASLYENHLNVKLFDEKYDKDLMAVAEIDYEPMEIFGNGIDSLGDMPADTKILIPVEGKTRALRLLAANGIIVLADGSESKEILTLDDVADPKGHVLELAEEIDILALLDGENPGTIALVSSDYVLNANRDPMDGLAADELNEDDMIKFANDLVIRSGDKDSALINALIQALTSDEMREYINANYKDIVIPMF